jgi:hypothetical protein
VTKAQQKKLAKQIEELIGDDIRHSAYILITDLIDWMEISNKSKEELQDSVSRSTVCRGNTHDNCNVEKTDSKYNATLGHHARKEIES